MLRRLRGPRWPSGTVHTHNSLVSQQTASEPARASCLGLQYAPGQTADGSTASSVVQASTKRHFCGRVCAREGRLHAVTATHALQGPEAKLPVAESVCGVICSTDVKIFFFFLFFFALRGCFTRVQLLICNLRLPLGTEPPVKMPKGMNPLQGFAILGLGSP